MRSVEEPAEAAAKLVEHAPGEDRLAIGASPGARGYRRVVVDDCGDHRIRLRERRCGVVEIDQRAVHDGSRGDDAAQRRGSVKDLDLLAGPRGEGAPEL